MDNIAKINKIASDAIADAVKKINAARDEAVKEEQGKCRFVPEYGKRYCFADPTNKVFYSFETWYNTDEDHHRLKAGLIKETTEEAAELGKRLYYTGWALGLSDVTDEMWDGESDFYLAYWEYKCKKIEIGHCTTIKHSGAYFTSKQKLQSAIDEIEASEPGAWVKYVLGVEV